MTNKNSGEDEQRVIYVKDAPTEKGILVNNTLTALLVIIMGSMWVSVDRMRDGINSAISNQTGIFVTLKSHSDDIKRVEDGSHEFETLFREHLTKFNHSK